MSSEKTTQVRIARTTNKALKDALKAASNGMSIGEFADTILRQAAAQILRAEPPEPLQIVETLRRQRGLGTADTLRSIVAQKQDLEAVVREIVKEEIKDLGKKYEAMRDAGKAMPKR